MSTQTPLFVTNDTVLLNYKNDVVTGTVTKANDRKATVLTSRNETLIFSQKTGCQLKSHSYYPLIAKVATAADIEKAQQSLESEKEFKSEQRARRDHNKAVADQIDQVRFARLLSLSDLPSQPVFVNYTVFGEAEALSFLAPNLRNHNLVSLFTVAFHPIQEIDWKATDADDNGDGYVYRTNWKATMTCTNGLDLDREQTAQNTKEDAVSQLLIRYFTNPVSAEDLGLSFI